MTGIDATSLRQQFASDNYAGICPEALQAMEVANSGHVTSYGEDPWTTKAADAFRELFETECEVYFVFNGTAANSLALASLCQSYHSVICCDQSHGDRRVRRAGVLLERIEAAGGDKQSGQAYA